MSVETGLRKSAINRLITGIRDIMAIGTATGATVMVPVIGMDRVRECQSISADLDFILGRVVAMRTVPIMDTVEAMALVGD